MQTEDAAIRSLVTRNDPLDWPSIANRPINEYKTPGLATQAFPTLFPYGCGDPTSPGRQRAVTLAQSFKHLIRYAEVIDDKFCWRFSTHPRFPYWALNMPLTQDFHIGH